MGNSVDVWGALKSLTIAQLMIVQPSEGKVPRIAQLSRCLSLDKRNF